MKSLFQIQTESGQLWLDIIAHLEAKDSSHAAQVASLGLDHQDAVNAKTAEMEAAKAAHAAELADLKSVHAAELAAVKSELADRNALIESAKTAIKGAIANPALDDAATVSTIAQVVAVAELPSIEKRKIAIAAEIAAKQAELDSLSTPEP